MRAFKSSWPRFGAQGVISETLAPHALQHVARFKDRVRGHPPRYAHPHSRFFYLENVYEAVVQHVVDVVGQALNGGTAQRRSTRIRKGSPWLKTALVQCAHSAARTKGSYFQALYHRIRARRGVNKAIVAVAASILTTIYHMLKDGTMYQDLGPNHFDQRTNERQKNRLIQRLANFGYAVELAPLPR